MSKSEIMTILLYYHFGSFRNLKHDYLFLIEEHLASYFLYAVSYTRFVELMPCVFFDLIPFMRIQGFGKCMGISFVDSMEKPLYFDPFGQTEFAHFGHNIIAPCKVLVQGSILFYPFRDSGFS